MIPARVNTPQPQNLRPEQQIKTDDGRGVEWIEQLSTELLHTVQAFQRLHAAFDSKFTGGHPDF